MLVHDTDAGGNRIVGRPSGDVASVHLERPCIGLHQAAEDAHQCRLAGAVLPDERVDLARHDLESSGAIRAYRSKELVDPRHPNGGFPSFRLFGCAAGTSRHLVLGTLIRPAMISCFSCSTRVCALSGMSGLLRLS